MATESQVYLFWARSFEFTVEILCCCNMRHFWWHGQPFFSLKCAVFCPLHSFPETLTFSMENASMGSLPIEPPFQSFYVILCCELLNRRDQHCIISKILSRSWARYVSGGFSGHVLYSLWIQNWLKSNPCWCFPMMDLTLWCWQSGQHTLSTIPSAAHKSARRWNIFDIGTPRRCHSVE